MKLTTARVYLFASIFLLSACTQFGSLSSRTTYEFEGERYEIASTYEGGTNTVSLLKLIGGHPTFVGSYSLDTNGQVSREEQAIYDRISQIIEEGREVYTSTTTPGIGGSD